MEYLLYSTRLLVSRIRGDEAIEFANQRHAPRRGAPPHLDTRRRRILHCSSREMSLPPRGVQVAEASAIAVLWVPRPAESQYLARRLLPVRV